jgi:hypothetical protein
MVKTEELVKRSGRDDTVGPIIHDSSSVSLFFRVRGVVSADACIVNEDLKSLPDSFGRRREPFLTFEWRSEEDLALGGGEVACDVGD